MIPRQEMADVLTSFGVPGEGKDTRSRRRMPTGRPVPGPVAEPVNGVLDLAALHTILAVVRASGSDELVMSARDVDGLPDGITVVHDDGSYGLLAPGQVGLTPCSVVLSLLGDIETAVAEHGGHGYRLLLATAGRQCAAMARAAASMGLHVERCRPLATRELRPLAPVDGAGRAILCGLLLRGTPARPSGQEEKS